MAKIKIHEIAKNLNLSSKEVLDKAIELGMNVKTHLSGVEEEEAKRIEAAFAHKDNQKEKAKKEVKEKSKDAPVIIRRQVIMNEPVKKQTEVRKDNHQDRGIGFVERERKQDYNIVYRNKQTKPLNISELFGNKKEEPKTTTTTTTSETIEQETKEEKKEEVKKEIISEKENNVSPQKIEEKEAKKDIINDEKTTVKVENQQQYNNNNNQNRNFGNKETQGNRPYNRDNQGYNRPYNNQNKPFNRNNPNNRNFNNDR